VTNLPKEGLTSGILWKKMRKYDGVESVVWPVEEDVTIGRSGATKRASTAAHLIHCIAHVIFKTPVTASAALAKLHSHLYKGTILSVVLKKRSDSLIKSDPAVKSAKPSRGGRLIIRNLPWNVRFKPEAPLPPRMSRTDHTFVSDYC
jgi:nucleolar protein 4